MSAFLLERCRSTRPLPLLPAAALLTISRLRFHYICQDEILQFQQNVTVDTLSRLRAVNTAVEARLAHLTEVGRVQVPCCQRWAVLGDVRSRRCYFVLTAHGSASVTSCPTE